MSKNKKTIFQGIDSIYSTKRRKFTLHVPSNLRVLCALLEVTPEKLLKDFMWTVSYSFYNATEEQRTAAVEYFIECGYGQQLYREEDIRLMFKELEAQHLLQIEDTRGENWDFFQEHMRWMNMYIKYWYKKWFYKVPRKKGLEVLGKY